jgi:hypothetical protein
MKNSATWKQTERTIATRLHGRRVGPTGTATADVVTPWLAVECKHRATIPQWLTGALQQAVNAAEPGQLAIAVLHAAGTRHDRDIVMLRLADFQEWFGSGTDIVV